MDVAKPAKRNKIKNHIGACVSIENDKRKKKKKKKTKRTKRKKERERENYNIDTASKHAQTYLFQ
jgi:hypothetical protein